MLTLTFSTALCVLLACWRPWRRRLDKVAANFRITTALVRTYWILGILLCVDILLSIGVSTDDLTKAQFKVLLILAIGTILKLPIFSLVLAPVALRTHSNESSFTKALILVEGCAFASAVLLTVAVVWVWHARAALGYWK